jgi:hypothetical protein
MQKDPQVLPGDVKLSANLIFVSLIQENPLKHLSILILKFAERPLHQVRPFVLKQAGFSAGLPAGNLTRVFGELTQAAVAAEHLLHHVIGHGIHVSPQALRVFDHAPPEVSQYAQQGLLRDILRQVPGPQARYGFDADQIAEILGEMLRRCFIVFAKASNVIRVK